MAQTIAYDWREHGGSDPPPPPYMLLLPLKSLPEGHERQDKTLSCILTTLARERTLPCRASTDIQQPYFTLLGLHEEAKRLHHFMLFIHAVDYGHGDAVSLDFTEQDFFTTVGWWLVDLGSGGTFFCFCFCFWLLVLCQTSILDTGPSAWVGILKTTAYADV